MNFSSRRQLFSLKLEEKVSTPFTGVSLSVWVIYDGICEKCLEQEHKLSTVEQTLKVFKTEKAKSFPIKLMLNQYLKLIGS
jgi:hypothetical protein